MHSGLTDMKELDIWAAEKCANDIEIMEYRGRRGIEINDFNSRINQFVTWTLLDARCRAIFWEWYLSQKEAWYFSLEIGNVRGGKSFEVMRQFDHLHHGKGKTIEEAEIACIQAIMDNE